MVAALLQESSGSSEGQLFSVSAARTKIRMQCTEKEITFAQTAGLLVRRRAGESLVVQLDFAGTGLAVLKSQAGRAEKKCERSGW
jgi:hypothetical protein